MFIPDEAHSLLDSSQSKLFSILEDLGKCKKFADTLQLLVTAKEVGLYHEVLEIVMKNRHKILSVDFAALQQTVVEVNTNLVKVSALVPNTTPPDPSGFESYPAK